MTLQLHHVQICVPVGAEESAREFYCELLGLAEIPKPDSLKHRGGFWVRLEPVDLHIGAQDRDGRAGPKDHVAYLVDDLELWKSKIRDYGLTVRESIPIPGFDRFETKDPFGNRVEIIQRSESEKSFQLNQELSDTLVIHCADPRFRAVFERYIKNELGVKHYTLISVAGGAGAFVSHDSAVGEVKVILEDLRLFLAGVDLQRVVAINHELCRWYGKELPDLKHSEMAKRQADDLRRFAIAIRSEYSRLQVETHMAIVEGERIHFQPEL